jgi:DNA-binding transcriptional LysR family regulator
MLLFHDVISNLYGCAMPRTDRIERRIKLHDLQALMTVAQAGSMGKGAQVLNTSQPAISRSIADLEHAVGQRLLDRSRRGVELTKYGRALLNCGSAMFDDLRQGLKQLEFLADPTVGEIRIGGNEAFVAGLLATVYERLRRRYPKIAIHVTQIPVVSQQIRELRERNVDLIIGRIGQSIEADIAAEVLFHDRTFVVANPENKWSRRRKIKLADLADDTWALSPPDTLIGSVIAEAFRASGIDPQRRSVATGSIHLQTALLASGPFLIVIPGSVLRFSKNLPPLKVLPVDLPVPAWPFGIMTLKNRPIGPAVQLFIECAREVAKPLARPAP